MQLCMLLSPFPGEKSVQVFEVGLHSVALPLHKLPCAVRKLLLECVVIVLQGAFIAAAAILNQIVLIFGANPSFKIHPAPVQNASIMRVACCLFPESLHLLAQFGRKALSLSRNACQPIAHGMIMHALCRFRIPFFRVMGGCDQILQNLHGLLFVARHNSRFVDVKPQTTVTFAPRVTGSFRSSNCGNRLLPLRISATEIMASQEGTSQNQMVDDGIDHRLQTRDLDGTLAGISQCSAFYRLIQGADLDYLLRRSGLHMLLAPTDEAMANNTPADPETFLNRHIFPGAMESFDLRNSQRVKSLGGDVLPVQVHDGSIRIANVNLLRTDIACTNGVIHVVDGVLSD